MIDNRPALPWMEGGQRAIDFAKQQGNNPVWNRVTRQYLLPTGARMSADGRGLGEPPAHPHLRLHYRRLYWKLLTERTASHVSELGDPDRLSVRWRRELYGPGPAAREDAVRHLKKLLAEQRAALAAVEGELRAVHVAHP